MGGRRGRCVLCSRCKSHGCSPEKAKPAAGFMLHKRRLWPKLHYGAKVLLFPSGPQPPADLGWAKNPSTEAAAGPLLILPPRVGTQSAAQAVRTGRLPCCYRASQK